MSYKKLLEEVEKERKNIKTDHYSMSIGEIINLYNDGDLNLNPAFQRLFRWDDFQKTKFIESVLLGIPIPQIFVSQKKDGKWDVVDGVQRVSTLLQLSGNLQGYFPLKMTTSKYLPHLEGLTFENLSPDIKRIFRRGKIGVNIILTENSINAQYELFQRLNSGGLHLEDQEIRNCLLIMLDNKFYEKINKLKDYSNFKSCLSIKDDAFKKEFHMELILRYLISKLDIVDYSEYNMSKSKFSEFIDKEITRIIESKKVDLDKEIEVFKKTFDWLHLVLGKNAFKKFKDDKSDFQGAFSISSFESIVPGVANNIDKITSLNKSEFEKIVIDMYLSDDFNTFTTHGVKALTRFKKLSKFTKEYFDL